MRRSILVEVDLFVEGGARNVYEKVWFGRGESFDVVKSEVHTIFLSSGD